MSAEFWAIVGVGVALAGLHWRMHAALRQDLNARIGDLSGRMDSLTARLDAMQADLANVKERLARVEGVLDLLMRGLHIEMQGGGTA